MGLVTLNGELRLNGSNSPVDFFFNTPLVFVTQNLTSSGNATIYFNNKCTFKLPDNGILKVWHGLNGGIEGLSGSCNNNQKIFIGTINFAACNGAPGSIFTFAELMDAGGTLDAIETAPLLSCLGQPIQLAGNYAGAIGTPVTYKWTSTGPAPLTFSPSATDQNPTVTPGVPGTYTVSLTVSTMKGTIIYSNTENSTLVIPPTSSTHYKTVCSSEIPYTWDGLVFYNSGVQSITFPNIAGCDSVSTLILTVNTPTGSSTTDSICTGGSYVFNGTTYTSPGTYSATLTNSEGCDSIAVLQLIPCKQSSLLSCPVTVSDIKICPNTNGQLQASGADYYYWSPAAGLNDTTIANPIVNVSATTNYTLTAFTEDPTNLILNGNFESGNQSFSSNYTYTTSSLIPEGYYAVGTNPKSFHSSFSACGDHTTGTGKMLIVNGNTIANSKIWGQTITVQPYKYYAFYAYVTPVYPSNPPVIQFSINGNVLGTPFSSPGVTCTWNKFYAIWYSGSNTSADISIVNQNIIANGNDFAIDDIKYVELCKTVENVKVTVGPSFSVTNLTVCSGSLPYIWNGITCNSEGTYSFPTKSVIGCDSTAVLNLTVNPLPTVTNTTLTQTICSGTSTTLVPLTSDVASTTFEWTASSDTGITGFAASGTDTIPAQTLINPSNTTAGTVTYVITPTANGCTGTPVNYVVTVTPEPVTSDIYHQ